MSVVQVMKGADFSGDGGHGNQFRPNTESVKLQAKTGLRFFMAVISSLFFLLIVAFMIRSQLSDWEHLSAPWMPLAEPWQLWVNTIVLVLASVFLQWSRVAAKHARADRAVEGLLLAGVFTLAFLVGQLLVWRQMVHLGYLCRLIRPIVFSFC